VEGVGIQAITDNYILSKRSKGVELKINGEKEEFSSEDEGSDYQIMRDNS